MRSNTLVFICSYSGFKRSSHSGSSANKDAPSRRKQLVRRGAHSPLAPQFSEDKNASA
jgi:hypothetical protein